MSEKNLERFGFVKLVNFEFKRLKLEEMGLELFLKFKTLNSSEMNYERCFEKEFWELNG